MVKYNKSKKMEGGDGYAVNVFQPIAGRPSYIRYTDNCRPVFNGSLLQGGGSNNYYPPLVDPTKPNVDGTNSPALNLIQNTNSNIKGYNFNDFNIIDTRPQSAGGPKCDCDADKNPLMEWLNTERKNQSLKEKGKQSGGFISTGLEPFAAIQTLSKTLMPLGANALASLILLLFIHNTVKNKLKQKKAVMMGGAVGTLESVLMPLGKNNMVVLAAILLLHHYAKKKIEKGKSIMKGGSIKKNQMGGSITSVLGKLVAPLGINTLGASVLLIALRQAFIKKVIKKGDLMKGGFESELRKNVMKVSPKQFLAKGLFKNLEELFTLKMKNSKKTDSKFEELFNDIAPVTFSTFATKKAYKKSYELKNFIVNKNNKTKK